MSRNKEIILKMHKEIWSEGKTDVCEEFYTNDFVCHFLIGPEWHGPEGVRKHVTELRRAFPDWREEVADIIAENDRVVTRFISTGTQQGEFEGIAPSGKKVRVNEVAVFRMKDGKIAEQWGFPDIAGLRRQLTGGGAASE